MLHTVLVRTCERSCSAFDSAGCLVRQVYNCIISRVTLKGRPGVDFSGEVWQI